LVDGSEIVVVRVEATGVVAVSGIVPVWVNAGGATAVGASSEVAGAVAARGVVEVAAVVEVQLMVAVPGVIF
jgi:hypothetical protein